jgi:hypothetical protein
MINVLKQAGGGGWGRRDSNDFIGQVGGKFHGYDIGSTSEIVDVGQIKDGIKGLRKAYKTHPAASAFAIYIGGTAVMFGTFEAHTLAGSSRAGRLAYDLSAYKEILDRIHAGKYSRPAISTASTKEPGYWEREQAERSGKIAKAAHYAGRMVSTSELSNLFDDIMVIAKETNQPVTAKLVMSDAEAAQKRKKRYSNRDIEAGVEDLKTRLTKFKLSKKPTAASIEQFLDMAMKSPGKIVQFAGRSYKLTATSYDKLDPAALLSGKSFVTRYACTDPGAYDSLDLTYAFDPATSMLKPISAVWYDRTDPTTPHNRQEAVLDGAIYSKGALGVRDLDDKKAVITKLLGMAKDAQWQKVITIVGALKKAGKDWPELDIVEKSALAEKGKKEVA